MKKVKVVSNFSYDYTQFKGEVNSLPSETIPGMASSIKDLLIQYKSGVPLPTRAVDYDEEDFPDSPNPLASAIDLTDLDDVKAELSKLEDFVQRASKKVTSSPKPDTPKPDTPKPDTPKPDTPKPDSSKSGTPSSNVNIA